MQTKLYRDFRHPRLGEEIPTRDVFKLRDGMTARIFPPPNLREFHKRFNTEMSATWSTNGIFVSELHYLLQFKGCWKYTC
jgi:hypothetical protein